MVRKFGPFDTSQFYEVENRRMQKALAACSGTSATGFVKSGQGAVTAGTGAQLVIAAYPDGALIDGLYVENPATEAVTVTTNTGSTNPRIDRLVMRLDMTAKTIAPFQIVGTPAASPAVPPLVKTDTVVDMPLCRYQFPGSASAQNPGSIVDEHLLLPRTLTYNVGGWTNTTYPNTQNVNLGTLTIDPKIGPFSADVRAAAFVTGSAGTDGSLRLFNAGTQQALHVIGAGKGSPHVSKVIVSSSGDPITVTANLEVLAGSVTTYADTTHSFLEAVVTPL